MQNKPNSRKAKMKLSLYLEKGYENKPYLRVLVKQTQSNPIKPNFKRGIYIVLWSVAQDRNSKNYSAFD